MRDPIIPSIRDVLLDLLPAFLAGIIDDVRAMMLEVWADVMTHLVGDVT